ncbi:MULTISPECIES: GNAT family N-acetyltransferase [unclassified Anabaena]|uniref:GNAT family N-acetyltransferase n=1 Tax=unclassified Anabaena TaxID=2619674 RepID=UPI0008359BB4|nr:MULTISPECIES: GNAT family N-acetyltransferase [unclassified Anabaena]
MSSQPILLRPAQETDAWVLSAIHIAAIKALPTTFYNRQELLAWRNYRNHPDGASILKHLKLPTIWVAIAQENITGFASYIADELIALYVHPHYQSQGIGRTLVEHFFHSAKQQGVDRVFTTASLYAEGFYLRLGFTPINTVPHHLGKGLIVPVIEMTKELK